MERRSELSGGENATEKELMALWGEYQKYKHNHPKKLEIYDGVINGYCEDHDLDVDGEILARAIERLMIFDFGLSLAEKKSSVVASRIWPCQIVLVNPEWDEGMEGEKGEGSDFVFSVLATDEQTLELLVDAEALFSEEESSFGEEIDFIIPDSNLVSIYDFVFHLETSFEEYGHMAYDSIKSPEVQAADDETRWRIEAALERISNVNTQEIMYHTSDSEFRGLVWKGWFFYKYLPSMQYVCRELKKQSGKVRRRRFNRK